MNRWSKILASVLLGGAFVLCGFRIGGFLVQHYKTKIVFRDTGRIGFGSDEDYKVAFDGTSFNVTSNAAGSTTGDVRLISDSASPADDDVYRVTWYADDDGGNSDAIARLTMTQLDVTDGTEDADLTLGVITAGTLADELVLTGEAIAPNTDEGLDLGSSSAEFKDAYIDGTAYIDTLNASGYTVVVGTGEVDNGQSADTLTVAGTDSDDLVFVTIIEDPVNAVYLKNAIAGTDQIVVTLSSDPGTTLTYSYQVWQD